MQQLYSELSKSNSHVLLFLDHVNMQGSVYFFAALLLTVGMVVVFLLFGQKDRLLFVLKLQRQQKDGCIDSLPVTSIHIVMNDVAGTSTTTPLRQHDNVPADLQATD